MSESSSASFSSASFLGDWKMTTALLERRAALPRKVPELTVCREEIVFYNVAPGRVRLSVNVANVGPLRSTPTVMRIQAAPLGAFVPWNDLTAIVVPSIGPAGSAEVTAEFSAPQTAPGQFGSVPPDKLWTTVADDDEPEPGPGQGSFPARTLVNLLQRALGRRPRQQRPLELPNDPMQVLSGPNPHWAGNINVLLGQQAVERHLAQALRIYPGRTNLAMFIVGDRSDRYQFDFQGSGAAWDPALFNFTARQVVADAANPKYSIPTGEWIAIGRCQMIMLAVRPPRDCDSGSLMVHVRQRSTHREAIVEFSMDPHAAGAGCYTV
jgi:hypothetical protein